MATQGRDDADVLEVTDLAHAIARAEEVIRARSSSCLLSLVGPDSSESFDIFDALVATDDAAGPAVHVPYVPTPIPPPHAAPTFHLPPPTPLPCIPGGPRAVTREAPGTPVLVPGEDHPWRIRRATAEHAVSSRASRARRLSWMTAAVLAPVALVGFVVDLGHAVQGVDPSSTSIAIAVASPIPGAERLPAPSGAELGAPRAAARLEPTVEPTFAPGEAAPSIPVLHVNSLKSVPPAGTRSR